MSPWDTYLIKAVTQNWCKFSQAYIIIKELFTNNFKVSFEVLDFFKIKHW